MEKIDLIITCKNIIITAFVQPICVMGLINPAVQNIDGGKLENFEIAGWGMTDITGNKNEIFNKTSVLKDYYVSR